MKKLHDPAIEEAHHDEITWTSFIVLDSDFSVGSFMFGSRSHTSRAHACAFTHDQGSCEPAPWYACIPRYIGLLTVHTL